MLERVGVDTIPPAADVARDGQMRTWWDRTPIDVFFAYDPVHDAVRAAVRTVPCGASKIPILAPEHLVVAKVAFDRPRDWLDVEQMLVGLDDLDLPEIRRWLEHLVGKRDRRATRLQKLVTELRGKE